MSLFKAWLSLWIALAMIAGLALGYGFPAIFQSLGGFTIASVNPVTAILVWMLIFPTMVQIDYSGLPQVWRSRHWRQASLLTTSVNWLIKPFTMAILAILFLEVLFAPWVGPDAIGYIAVLLLGITGIEIPWNTLGLATLVYVVVPLVAGYAFQQLLARKGSSALQAFDAAVGPLTKVGLILIVVLLFGFQAMAIIAQPLVIALIAVPVILQALLVEVPIMLALVAFINRTGHHLDARLLANPT